VEDEVKKYNIGLTETERKQLKELVTKGKTEAYKIKHANILLAADTNGPAWSDKDIAKAFSVSTNTVASVRQRFISGGMERSLGHKKQDSPSHQPIFDGEGEARLIALSCSKAPEGYNHWTLRLLAEKVVQLEIVDRVSYETVRRTLKKRTQAPFG
jgi:hypothetical protein